MTGRVLVKNRERLGVRGFLFVGDFSTSSSFLYPFLAIS